MSTIPLSLFIHTHIIKCKAGHLRLFILFLYNNKLYYFQSFLWSETGWVSRYRGIGYLNRPGPEIGSSYCDVGLKVTSWTVHCRTANPSRCPALNIITACVPQYIVTTRGMNGLIVNGPAVSAGRYRIVSRRWPRGVGWFVKSHESKQRRMKMLNGWIDGSCVYTWC